MRVLVSVEGYRQSVNNAGIQIPFCFQTIVKRALPHQFVQPVKGIVIAGNQYFTGILSHRRQACLGGCIALCPRLSGSRPNR